MLAGLWGTVRNSLSVIIDVFVSRTQKRKLPNFDSPQDIAEYLQKYCVYVPDGVDFTHDPQHLQWAIETQAFANKAQFTCDCDDYAFYAYRAIKDSTKFIANPILLTLSGTGLNDHHMICSYYMVDKLTNKQSVGAIDTNGHHSLTALTSYDILTYFNNLYRQQGIKFVKVFSTQYPFKY